MGLNIVERLYNKKVDPTGLAIFRMCIGVVLFWEVYELFNYRHLIFDDIPYIRFSIIDFKYVLVLWLAVIGCIILGLFTRIATIINYVLTLVFFATIKYFGNHMLDMFVAVNFLLMFTSIGKVLSLDAVIAKLQVKEIPKTSNGVSVLNYYSFVFVTLMLVYFPSIFSKIATDYWQSGLVLWKFLSIPVEFARYDFSVFLNHKYFMQFLAYTSLLFEAVFIFICLHKRWRVWAFLLGVILHLGILICFPFTLFALGYLSLYVLLIPFSFWNNVKKSFKNSQSATLFIFKGYIHASLLSRLIKSIDVFHTFQIILLDSSSKNLMELEDSTNFYVQGRSGVISESLKVIRYVCVRLPFYTLIGILMYIPYLGNGIYNFARLCVVGCINVNSFEGSQNSGQIKDVKIKIISSFFIVVVLLQCHQMLDAKFFKNIGMPQGITQIKDFARSVIGLSEHSVFAYDYELNNAQLYSIGITYLDSEKEIWLPLSQKNGNLGAYKKDPVRKKSFYSSKTTKLDSVRINRYVRTFTAFWSGKNKVDLDNAHFNVYIKKLKIPTEWEKDLYQKNRNKPWISLGHIIWQDTLYTSKLKTQKLIN